ncbi:MAG TPA: methyltransferase domain-containing protein [Candidatus Binataceae bacterium]|nr:methyltransferase domain-containing protein [Candidatus Binataceae bacterium]
MISRGDIFTELTEGLPRQGPGSTAATLRALGLACGLPQHPRILDLGCGNGAQTIDLARATGGNVIALDIRGEFLNELSARAKASGVEHQIETRKQSMFEMDFPDNYFDLIWSEGAVYIRGFGNGLKEWRRFIKPGGWLTVSELTWLIADPPAQAREFWAENYPAMRSLEQNRQIAIDTGYEVPQTFVLTAKDWWLNYYGPGETRLLEVLKRHESSPEIVELLQTIRREYDLFRAHPDSYGYVFYVMRKPTP